MKEGMTLRGTWEIKKYRNEADAKADRPYEVRTFHNLFATVGLQALGRLLTAQGSVSPFSNANACIGVGDSNTAAAVGQTDLQASSNKLRKAMVATYPTDPSGGVWVFQSSFGSSEANFAWAEFAVFNASSSGIMLNRGVSAQGTKTSGQVWTATVTITVT